MAHREELGKKVAETVAVKAYDRYGDKIPVNVDPTKVADAAYGAVMRKKEKEERRRHRHHIIMAIGISAAITACATVAVAALVITKADEHLHGKK